MVFSSDYFDPPPPPNWHQNQQQQSGIFSPDHALQIQTPPPAQAGGGSGAGPGSIRPGSMLDRARMARLPLPEPGLKCPRCDSSNTKFCYFNNYNLTQPRHFCKACRRYWTRGGALRNVPVGGGCRRNKRSKRTKSAPAQPTQRNNDDNVSTSINTNGNGNGNGVGNSFSSQMFLPPPPQLQYLSALHHFNGYPGGFGLNLGGGGGAFEFEMGAGSSNGVSRAQQLSNLLSGSGATGNGLYPFRHGSATAHELDHGSGFGGQVARVKAEENNNNGLNLSKDVTMGTQGNDDGDDQFSNWGSGNAWTDISGFDALGARGYGDRT